MGPDTISAWLLGLQIVYQVGWSVVDRQWHQKEGKDHLEALRNIKISIDLVKNILVQQMVPVATADTTRPSPRTTRPSPSTLIETLQHIKSALDDINRTLGDGALPDNITAGVTEAINSATAIGSENDLTKTIQHCKTSLDSINGMLSDDTRQKEMIAAINAASETLKDLVDSLKESLGRSGASLEELPDAQNRENHPPRVNPGALSTTLDAAHGTLAPST